MTAASEALSADAKPTFLARCLRRFSLSQRDGLIILILFLWAMALLDPFVSVLMSRRSSGITGGDFIFAAVGGCIAALAFAAGRCRLVKTTGMVVLLGCLVSFAFSFIGERQVHSGPAMPEMFGFQANDGASVGFTDNLVKAAIVYVVGFLAIWLATLILSKSAGWMRGKFFDGNKISRARVLIILAIGLFIAQLIQKVFFTGDSGFGLRGEFAATAWPAIFGGGVALTSAVVAGNFLTDRFWKLRWKLTLIFLFLVAGGLIAATGGGPYASKKLLWSSAFGFIFAFLWTLLIAHPVAPEESERPNHNRRMSVWSFLAVAVFGCAALVVWGLDAIVLRDSQFQDWQLARRVKEIRRITDDQVRLDTHRAGGLVYNSALCRLYENAESDVLECLGTEGFAGLTIVGLTPNVDTKPIKARAFYLQLQDSNISSSQFKDLIEGAGFGKTLRNVEVVDSENAIDLGKVPQLSIEAHQPGQIASILKPVSTVGSLGYIDVVAQQFSAEDLNEMVRVSERLSIVVGGDFVESLDKFDQLEAKTLGGLALDLNRSPLRSEKVLGQNVHMLQFVLENDIFLILPNSPPDQLFWDLVFAKNLECFGGFQSLAFNQRLYRDPADMSLSHQLSENAERYHWSFGRDANNQITDLYLPCGETFLEGFDAADRTSLANIEVLGFDPNWLTRVDPKSAFWRANGQWGAKREITGKVFAAMPHLKRLDLSPSTTVTNNNFLNLIPSIEHLQIQFEETTKWNVDFSVCKNLKTLVYFGAPPKSTMKQLAGLKRLESVIVVDLVDGSLFQDSAVKNLKKSIPGIEVLVIKAADFLAVPPAKFQNHVEKKSVEMRKKLLEKPSETTAFDEASPVIDNSNGK